MRNHIPAARIAALVKIPWRLEILRVHEIFGFVMVWIVTLHALGSSPFTNAHKDAGGSLCMVLELARLAMLVKHEA